MPHELPDDLAAWPSDPFQVLGVSRQADERALKVAYSQLIRRFKPEKLPEHFQRVRSAYEQAQQLLQVMRAFGGEIVEHTQLPSGEIRVRLRSAEEPPAPEPPTQQRPTSSSPAAAAPPINPIAQAWELLHDNPAQAYAQLQAYLDQPPPALAPAATAQAHAMLYWLLVVYPKLDSACSPLDWLVRGLERFHEHHTLRELYRREVARNPDEACTSRFDRVLRASRAPRWIESWLTLRWEAAAHVPRYASGNLVLDDLGQWRTHLTWEDHNAWLRLVALGIRRCALAETPLLKPLTELMQELERESTSRSGIEREVDALEWLWGESHDWRPLLHCKVPLPWRRLALADCLYPRNEHHADFATVLQDIAGQPAQAVQYFDLLRACDPATLEPLVWLLQQYCERKGVEITGGSPPDTMPSPPTVLKFTPFTDARFRQELFQFSLSECIHPLTAIAAWRMENAYEPVRDDLSVCLIFSVWQAFWQAPATQA